MSFSSFVSINNPSTYSHIMTYSPLQIRSAKRHYSDSGPLVRNIQDHLIPALSGKPFDKGRLLPSCLLIVDQIAEVRRIYNGLDTSKTSHSGALADALVKLYAIQREVSLSSGAYLSIDPFAPIPLRFSSAIFAVCDVSYRGFCRPVLLIEPPPIGITSVAESSGISIAIYRKRLPDFMTNPSDQLAVRSLTLPLTTAEDGYFAGSSKDALRALEDWGVDLTLFAHYAIHEMRHNLNFGSNTTLYSLSNGDSVSSVFRLRNRITHYSSFDESTAYLAMVVDGPNVLLPLLRMLTLINSRGFKSSHREGSILALEQLCSLLGINDDLGDEPVQDQLLDCFSGLSPATLRTMTAAALRSMYYDSYLIDSSNTFD